VIGGLKGSGGNVFRLNDELEMVGARSGGGFPSGAIADRNPHPRSPQSFYASELLKMGSSCKALLIQVAVGGQRRNSRRGTLITPGYPGRTNPWSSLPPGAMEKIEP